MLYAVTVKKMPYALFFLHEPPGEGPWEVEDGVDLDISYDIAEWPEGIERPKQVIARSNQDPKHYRIYKWGNDIESSDFARTDKTFAGLYSQSSWQRFARDVLPRMLDHSTIKEDEPEASAIVVH